MTQSRTRLIVVAAAFLGVLCATSPAAAAESGPDASQAAVMAGLNDAARAKLAVSEKRLTSGEWAESNASAGYVPNSEAAAKVSVGAGGTITILYASPAELAGSSIVLTPSAADGGVVRWSCEGRGVPADALPSGCR